MDFHWTKGYRVVRGIEEKGKFLTLATPIPLDSSFVPSYNHKLPPLRLKTKKLVGNHAHNTVLYSLGYKLLKLPSADNTQLYSIFFLYFFFRYQTRKLGVKMFE